MVPTTKAKNIFNLLHHLNKCLDRYLKRYDNILITGDPNNEDCENSINSSCNVNPFNPLVKEPLGFSTQVIHYEYIYLPQIEHTIFKMQALFKEEL